MVTVLLKALNNSLLKSLLIFRRIKTLVFGLGQGGEREWTKRAFPLQALSNTNAKHIYSLCSLREIEEIKLNLKVYSNLICYNGEICLQKYS